MVYLLIMQLALRPDLSPGAAKPMTVGSVCAPIWHPDQPGDVPSTLWRSVLTKYGIKWEKRADYVAVRVIPGALGGVIAIENIAPLPKKGEWNDARKTQVEQRVYAELCANRLHLEEARQKAGTGWVTTWRTYFGR